MKLYMEGGGLIGARGGLIAIDLRTWLTEFGPAVGQSTSFSQAGWRCGWPASAYMEGKLKLLGPIALFVYRNLDFCRHVCVFLKFALGR